MRKSILRFGALALMSLMSIGAWAQLNVGDAFEDANGNSYLVTSNDAATLVSLADAEGNAVNLGKVAYSKTSYKITEVGPSASVRVSTNTVEVTIPKNLTVKLGIQAFANAKVTVKLEDGILNSSTEIGANAFKNATVTTTKSDKFLDFRDAELKANAFFDVNFEKGARIYMGEKELLEGVFGASSPKDDIETIQFSLSSKITSVPAKALMNRTGLKDFGYNDGSYLLPTNLTSIGAYAFAWTKLTQFKFSDRDVNSRITEVGANAFYGCDWLNDAVFANVCKTFEGLTFAEGSFYDCSLTSVDLSSWAVIANAMTIKEGKVSTNYKGIPANAFYGNPITTLKYPAGLEAIGDYAFFGNKLAKISLPEGLLYVGAGALESADKETSVKFSQDKLLLPKSLKKIFPQGIGNRKFTGIYAHPDIVGNVTYPAYEAPTMDNTEYTLYVPAYAPWKEDKTTKTVKAKYIDAKWSNVKYVDLLWPSRQTGPVDNTLYRVTGSCNNDADNGGYYLGKVDQECRVKDKDNEKAMTVRGMVSFGMDEVTVDGITYKYPAVVKVSMPDPIPANEFVTKITFEPQSVAVDIYNEQAEQVAQEFANGINDFTIPDNAFNAGWKALTSVTINRGVTSIGENAFKDCPIAGVTFADDATLASVGANAFANTKITAVSLPTSLNAIGASAFATATLKTVNVGYDAKSIPAIPADAFHAEGGTFTALLNVGGKATREDYLLKDGWKQFFDNAVTVNVTKNEKDAKEIRIATIDGQKGARIYQLKDAGDIAKVSVTGVPEKGAPKVQYIRDFKNTNFQAWYVPFDYTYKGSDDFKFYYIYDTKQSDFTADGNTSIELKEVAVGKDGTVIKANTPYVIQATAAKELTFEADAIMNTTAGTTITVGNVQNQFTFTGIYTRKTGVKDEKDNWYALSGGKLDNYKGKTDFGVNAYRFYMTYEGQTNPYDLVKFVVLDDEDATAIENVKANSLNAPMFDLMGRQIAAPAKGQVYIQNGVKKLAK